MRPAQHPPRWLGALLVTSLLVMLGVILPTANAQAAANASIAADHIVSKHIVSSYAIALHGEPALPANFTHFPYVNADAPKGGRIRFSSTGTFDSMNPFINRGNPPDGIQRIYDTLTTPSQDEAYTRYGLLAERIEHDPSDNSWVIYHLRPQARFSDGQPVRASDVVFTFKTLLSKGSPPIKAYYADVIGVDALDPLTVKFRFRSKNNRELPLTVGETAILPEHYWRHHDFDATNLEPPIGSGPYVIAGINPGRFISYRRNPNYWGANLPVNRGINNFDLISYQYYRDGTVAFEGFKAGQYDIREENKAKTWAKEYNFPAVRSGQVIKIDQKHENPSGMQGVAMNTRRAPLNDVRVRQALALTFDFEWSNRALFYGAYRRTVSYFDNSELAARGMPSAAELALLKPWAKTLPASVFGPAVMPPVSQGDGYNRANLLLAQQQLADAGWHYRNGALRNAAGEPMHFELLLVQPEMERVIAPMRRNMARLGITLDLRQLDVAQYVERLRQFDYDMTISGVGQSNSPGNEQTGFWGSQAADTPGSQNLTGIKLAAIDALNTGIIHARSREELITHVRALDRILRAEWLMIPQFHISTYRIAAWNHFGRPANPPRYGNNLDAWWWQDQPVVSTAPANRKTL